ncbi:MAG: type II toxin-antitoxin system Phd/YefM family antitoxin [Methylocapsa sp.]|nr:type II toxin-antitoxin system Phd/YefM family antitoxin [Methylocapsa sp.]
MMREISASEAKTHLPRLFGDVERGETIVITRHRQPIARLIPEESKRREDTARDLSDLDELRKIMPRLGIDDIPLARHSSFVDASVAAARAEHLILV